MNKSYNYNEIEDLMDKGHKISHRLFSKDEYIYKDDRGRMYTEDRCRFEEALGDRIEGEHSEMWQTGWFIYKGGAS